MVTANPSPMVVATAAVVVPLWPYRVLCDKGCTLGIRKRSRLPWGYPLCAAWTRTSPFNSTNLDALASPKASSLEVVS